MTLATQADIPAPPGNVAGAPVPEVPMFLLRASHVWNDEVMADVVFDEAAQLTIGPSKLATFVTPNLGLPESFAILRPGQNGYVLTLASSMTGEISIRGVTSDVQSFVSQSSSGSGAFRATAVGEGDHGVINLDPSGAHRLFFHFVKRQAPLPPPALGRDAELLLPALAFAVFLLGSIVTSSMAWFDAEDGSVFPGRRDLIAGYILNRPPPPPQEEEPKSGADDGEEEAPPTSSAGEEAKKGGEGDKPRKRAPDPDKGEPDEALPKIKKGLLTQKSRDKMKKLLNRGGFDKKLGLKVARMAGQSNDGGRKGYGDGKGTGIGTGTGTGTTKNGGKNGVGGGGNALGDLETTGAIKTGGKRRPKGTPGGNGIKEKKLRVKTGSARGSLAGRTKAEIRKVINSRKSRFRACYSRQLQRNKGLAGKVIIRWKIRPNGSVVGARVASTTVGSGAVEDCVRLTVSRLKFLPKPGGTATVTFPFFFSQQ